MGNILQFPVRKYPLWVLDRDISDPMEDTNIVAYEGEAISGDDYDSLIIHWGVDRDMLRKALGV